MLSIPLKQMSIKGSYFRYPKVTNTNTQINGYELTKRAKLE